jgi:hypothetical protein
MIRRSRGRSSSSEDEQIEESQWIPYDEPKIPKKRGRKPEDLKWTRVLKFSQTMDEFPPLYSVPRDLNMQRVDEEESRYQKEFQEKLILYHDGLKGGKESLSIEEHRLPESELRILAEKLIIV